MPPQACREIATKLVELTALKPGNLLLDIGAGTGEIGSEIVRLRPRYLGLDLSLPMVRVFQRRQPKVLAPLSLIVADANLPWPIADHCARAIFGSRSLHLLSVERLIEEAFRVLSGPGAMLVIGRVRRDPKSVKARMRREMRRLLGANERASQDGESQSGPLIEALLRRGGEAFAPLVASRWTTAHSPADSLSSWRSKQGLAGKNATDALKAEVLSKLESWALNEFQSLDKKFQSTEEYVLEGARLVRP